MNELIHLAAEFHIYLLALFIFFIAASGLSLIRSRKENLKLLLGLNLLLFLSVSYGVLLVFLKESHWPILTESWLFKIPSALWWFSLVFTLSQFLDFFVWKGIFVREGEPILPKILTDMIAGVLYFLALLMILSQVFHKPVAGLLATSGVLAVILGYSAQSAFGDLFAGLAINFDRQYVKGEWIVIDEIPGRIVDLNWRSVVLQDRHGNQVVLPNTRIAKACVTNYSRPDRVHCVTLEVMVETDTSSPHQVQKALTEAARDSDLLETDTPPSAWIAEITLHGTLYKLLYHTIHPYDLETKSGVASAIIYRFRRQGIILARKQQELSFAPPPKSNLPEETTANILARLQEISLFQLLTPEELANLATHVRPLVYGPPERIVVQGDQGTSLFILDAGMVDIVVQSQENTPLKVAELQAGAVFGEMALLTGDPRTATVRASTEVVVLEVTWDIFRPILQERQEIIDQISQLLATRRSATNAKLQEERRRIDSQPVEQDSLRERMIERMRILFA